MPQKYFIIRNQRYKTYNLKQSSRFLPTTKKSNQAITYWDTKKSPTLRNLTTIFEPKKNQIKLKKYINQQTNIVIFY